MDFQRVARHAKERALIKVLFDKDLLDAGRLLKGSSASLANLPAQDGSEPSDL